MGDPSTNKLLRGTLDLIVLRALQGADEPLHGLAVARWIRDHGDEAVGFEDAALYQALHRLQRQGHLESEWGRSDQNRRARFYRLTRKGRERLDEEKAAFRAYADAVTRLLESDA